MSAVLRGILLLLLPFLSLAFLPAAHAAQVPVPALSAWVTDQTGTLDSNTRTHLNTVLADLEKRKGAQIAVLVVPSTGEDTIEDYARRVFDQWRNGRDKEIGRASCTARVCQYVWITVVARSIKKKQTYKR